MASVIERPTEAGLWGREGKFYRVWLDHRWGDLYGEEITVDGKLSNYSLVAQLPTGNWQKLTVPQTNQEGIYEQLYQHAIQCVDRAFQECTENPKPILPDFLGIGADKFEGVVKLAEKYRAVSDKIAGLKQIIARQDEEIRELKKNLEREERDHLGTIDHRDQHEERINAIVGCLGLGEYESSWTSHNDPSERAIEAIEELQRKAAALSPKVIEGKGQQWQSGRWLCETPTGHVDLVVYSDSFLPGMRYMRCPTFPPRPAFVAPPKPEQVLVRTQQGELYWATKADGEWYLAVGGGWHRNVELLDETTGQPIQPGEKS